MRFEDVYWHDGLILGWNIESCVEKSKTGTVKFKMAIYEDLQAPDRFVVTVLFEEVESLSLICNFPDLADHFFAGHIDWASKEGARNYRFDLFGDNSFEVMSGKVSVLRET
jgi:hypothetical protein